MDLTFELLCDVLCDPLCFNDLYLTTKSHQGLTKVHKELFQQPLTPDAIYPVKKQENIIQPITI